MRPEAEQKEAVKGAGVTTEPEENQVGSIRPARIFDTLLILPEAKNRHGCRPEPSSTPSLTSCKPQRLPPPWRPTGW